jgi:DNA-binding response OmpR family regulator
MPRRILIADADRRLGEAYRKELVRHGSQVLTVTSGLDCVDRLRSFAPHLVILDPELPWGGGEGVLARMYEEPDVPLVPVMALAARPDPSGRRCVGVFPVRSYQVKPVPPESLAQRVSQLFAQRPRRGNRTRRFLG